MSGGVVERAWILGAGFSRPLGGPLLGDLLEYQSMSLINAGLPKPHRDGVDFVPGSLSARAFCAYGIDQHHWEHAEDFLDTVESSVADIEAGIQSHARRLIENILKNTVRYPINKRIVLANSGPLRSASVFH
jgi:hypothetical protein